jgi:hypothetical protein
MDSSSDSSNGTIGASRSGNGATKAPRKQRYLSGLPSASSAKDMQQALYTVLVDRTPTEFVSLDPTFRTLTVTKGFLLNIFSTMRVKKILYLHV